jgi:hypothetical protein
MVIAFSDEDDLLVETVSDRFDQDEEDEDTASNAGSEASMSEFDGRSSELPPMCLFGPKECLAMFTLPSDRPGLFRVCGNNKTVCKRPGHATGERAAAGYYEPIQARRYFDGKLDTFLSIDDFAAREKERGEAKALEMDLASSSLANRKKSPSEDYEVAAAQPFPEDLATSMRSTGKGSLKSSTSEKAEESGIVSNGIDPAAMMMMGMMEEMRKSMEKMNAELTSLKRNPHQTRAVVELESPSEVQPVIPIKKNIPPVSRSEAYYAVGHGLNGAQGVFRSWNEVAPLVMGVSKAVYKRCDNYDEAQEFVEVSRALKAKQMSGLPDGVPVSDIWYSVTNSKIGQFSVFPSWPEAEQHVTNVRGASVRKFYPYGEALSYVEGHQTAWRQQRLADESPTRRARSGEPVRETGFQSSTTFPERFSDESPTRAARTSEARRGARSHSFAKSGSNYPEEEDGPPSGDDSMRYPPGKLMGEDPSTGKTEELFGIDTEQSEEELMDALCPPDLAERMAQSLINGTIDAVALPGGLTSGGELEGSASEVGMLGEALEELVTQNRGSEGRTVRGDLRWRMDKRTALRTITSEEKLRVRIKQLKKLTPKVHKRMETLTSTVCKRSGWTDRARLHTWGTYGFLPVIVASSLRGYLSLHEHLLETVIECGWSYVTMEINHHVEELELIRTLADSRIHALCSLYCYLRDGKDKSWYSTTVQQKRNLAMARADMYPTYPLDRFPPPSPAPDLESNSPESNTCKHCCTSLHQGGMEACPWKNQSHDNARKSGAKALRTLAMGNPIRPKKGKEKENED